MNKLRVGGGGKRKKGDREEEEVGWRGGDQMTDKSIKYSRTHIITQYTQDPPSHLDVVIRQVGNTTVKIVEPLHVALLEKDLEMSNNTQLFDIYSMR